MKFRRKPLVVEADRYWPDRPWPKGICTECLANIISPHVHAAEGPMHVSPGDWVIKGVTGKYYPCRPDIFAATYDEVPEGEP